MSDAPKKRHCQKHLRGKDMSGLYDPRWRAHDALFPNSINSSARPCTTGTGSGTGPGGAHVSTAQLVDFPKR